MTYFLVRWQMERNGCFKYLLAIHANSQPLTLDYAAEVVGALLGQDILCL